MAKSPYQVLAERARGRMQALYGRTGERTKLAEAAGVGTSTVNNLLSGRPRNWRGSSAEKLEAGLRWRAGSIDAILQGGEPTKLPDKDPANGDRPIAPGLNVSQLLTIIGSVGAEHAALLQRILAVVEQTSSDVLDLREQQLRRWGEEEASAVPSTPPPRSRRRRVSDSFGSR